MNDLNALEQAARGIRDGTLVYDYPTFQLLIAAVREGAALRAALTKLIASADEYEFEAKAKGVWDARSVDGTIIRGIQQYRAALSATEPAEDAK